MAQVFVAYLKVKQKAGKSQSERLRQDDGVR